MSFISSSPFLSCVLSCWRIKTKREVHNDDNNRGGRTKKKKKNNNNNKGMTRKNVHSVDKDDGGVFALIKLLSWSEKIGQGNY